MKYDATVEHPAQVEFFHEDVNIGTWSQTLFSGAIKVDRKKVLMERVKQLLDAVKVAREHANMTDVKVEKTAEKIFDFVFAV